MKTQYEYSDSKYSIKYLSEKKDIISLCIKAEGYPLVVNRPQNIIAFKSTDNFDKKRIDYYNLNLTHILKSLGKHSTVKISKIFGPAEAIINSTNHSQIIFENIKKDEKFVFFDYPSLLFFSDNIYLRYVFQPKGILLNDMVQVELTGEGIFGYTGEGGIIEFEIKEGENAFINQFSIIGYKCNINEKLSFDIRVYGNVLAGKSMDYHYNFEGPLTIILKSQLLRNDIKNMTKSKGLVNYIKKFLDSKSPIPFPWS